MIEHFDQALPHGITLRCRATGPTDAPRLIFLHGFPEAAFVWDEVMLKLGTRFRCIAPNLRGFERSSSPTEVAAYRVKHLMADIAALVATTGSGPLAALVAHDWGGAVAWSLGVQQPQLMQRLLIINSPHPGTFLRELQQSTAQREASAYMNFLCRPDAEALLAENDYARLFAFFTEHSCRPWLTPELRVQYREVWGCGLTGALNYYRVSPMRPPTPTDPAAMGLDLPPETFAVKLPTHVLWGLADRALPPGLLDGLDVFVPEVQIQRVEDAGHWIIHEQPERVADWIASKL